MRLCGSGVPGYSAPCVEYSLPKLRPSSPFAQNWDKVRRRTLKSDKNENKEGTRTFQVGQEWELREEQESKSWEKWQQSD